jgi:serpin B
MRTILFMILAGALALGAAGCGEDNPAAPGDPLAVRQLPAEIAADAAEVVAGNNAFALELYRELIQDDDGNIFNSPFSISTAFAMAYGGGRGQTADEIADVFHFTVQERLHPCYHALLQSIDRGIGFGGYHLKTANRLWGDDDEVYVQDYLDLTREQYEAELERLNFADGEGSRQIINAWVEDRTEDRIQDLLPEGSIDRGTVLVLTNAIYFKGDWEVQFDPEETAESGFYRTPADMVTVPMMHRHDEELLFAELDGLKVLELPYTGRDLSMFFLLPDALDGLADLEAQLTPENLDAWMGAVELTEADVTLPRFEFTAEFILNDALTQMGMPAAFSPGADFSGIVPGGGIFISLAIHKAFVQVNEVGTEAAAATAIIFERGANTMFTANHPFLFLIRDNVTGSILFLGRVMDPSV